MWSLNGVESVVVCGVGKGLKPSSVDQVPLLFVVSMDRSTYTTEDDLYAKTSGTGKGYLRKQQFTMNIYVNAGLGEDADGYVELICKQGKVLDGRKFSKIEPEA
jgi:hypothetical protein